MHDLEPCLSERELVSKFIFDANVNSDNELQLLKTVGCNDVKQTPEKPVLVPLSIPLKTDSK